MKKHEELKQLKGVGPVTAKAFAAAGFTSLAKVASAEPEQLGKALSGRKVRVPANLKRVIRQANTLVRKQQPKTANGKKGDAPARKENSAFAQLLVKEIGAGLLKAPAIGPALLKRVIGHPPTRARIIREVIDDLG